MGWASHVIELYGVRRFIADIDRDRQFWRDGGGVIGSLLDWAANDGFSEFMSEHDQDYRDAHHFRQRDMLAALKSLRFTG